MEEEKKAEKMRIQEKGEKGREERDGEGKVLRGKEV